FELRVIGTKRRARLGLLQGTEEVDPKEAFLAAHLRNLLPDLRARHQPPVFVVAIDLQRAASKHRRPWPTRAAADNTSQSAGKTFTARKYERARHDPLTNDQCI